MLALLDEDKLSLLVAERRVQDGHYVHSYVWSYRLYCRHGGEDRDARRTVQTARYCQHVRVASWNKTAFIVKQL